MPLNDMEESMAVCYRESDLPVLGGKQSSAIISSLLNCKKIKSDIYSIKKPEKVYAAYGIPSNEVLLAYCKGTVPLMPLTMAGIVFTNKGVYFDAAPPNSYRNNVRKILYDDLGKYIFIQEGEHGPALAYTADTSIKLYTDTVFAVNLAAKETVDILQKIQNELLASSPTAKQQFIDLGESIISSAQDDIFCGMLSDTTNKLLEILIHNATTADFAAKAKAESLYRSCNFTAYYRFVNTLPKTVSTQMCDDLKAPDSLFAKKFIVDLSNMDNSFPRYYLEQIISNLLSETSHSILSLRIISYAAIRTYDDKSFQTAMENLQRHSRNDEIIFFEKLKGCYYNTQMLRVYNSIKHGKPVQDDWIHMHDSIGLNPLHYAIILGAETVADQLLQLKSWPNFDGPTQTEIDWIYHYEVPAAGAKGFSLYYLLRCTNEKVRELHEAVENLQTEFGNSVQVMDMLNAQERRTLSELNRLERMHADYEQIRTMRDSLDELYEEKKRADEEQAEIFKNWEAAKEELPRLEAELSSKARKQFLAMSKSPDPFVQYVYKLYIDHDYLHSVLRSTSKEDNAILYKNGNLVFVAPNFAEIDSKLAVDIDNCSKVDEAGDDIEQERRVPITPPYGTSWFSVNAHSNATILKAEYRALAKKYHPDVCQHPDSNSAMQQITAEYEDLLQNI